MEPRSRPPLTSANSQASPQSSISQEDYSGPWMEGDSDSDERDKDGVSRSLLTGEAPMAAEEEDLLESEWPVKEPRSSLGTENPDEVYVHLSCTRSTQPAEGNKERLSRHASEGDIDTDDLLPKESEELLRFPSANRDARKAREENLTSETTEGEFTGCKMPSKDIGSSQSTGKHGTKLQTSSCGQVRSNNQCSLNYKYTYDSTSVGGSTEAHPQKCMTMRNKIISPAEPEAAGSETRGSVVERNVDCKPLDFSMALEQWVQLDSASSKPPTPVVSRTSSRSLIIAPTPAVSSMVAQQLPTSAVKQDVQQGELLLHHLSLLKQKQEAQQMLARSPPLATVSQEPTNQGPRCHGSSSVVAREPPTVTGGRGEGGREGKQGGQTGGEKQQKVTGFHKTEAGTQKRWGKVRRDQEQDSSGPEGGRQIRGRVLRMDGEGGEDNQSDSGVSIDFSPGSTMDLNSTSDEVPTETPIEREIRLAAEREESLRLARGLTKTQEFVEIPVRKSILSQQLPTKLGRNQGKDWHFAGKKMQQEIEAEAHRERVLVQMGKVPGVYDKGNRQQLQERRQLFEAFQESQQSTPVPVSKRPSSSIGDFSVAEVQVSDTSAEGSAPEEPQSVDMLTDNQVAAAPAAHGPTLVEGTCKQVIILESGNFLRNANAHQDQLSGPSPSTGSVTETSRPTVVDQRGMETGQVVESNEEAEVDSALPRENPFFKLRSSMSLRPELEQDIREAWERERELRKQRSSLYRAEAGGSWPSSSETRSSKPERNGLSSEPPSTTSSVLFAATPPAARQSRKLDLVWPPPQADPEGAAQTEASRSPRTARQKHPLLQRWEAGMVNGSEEGQD